MAGDKKASLNKIKKDLNIKNASMASAEEVKDITGYTIGGVSPVGHLKKISVFIDNSLKDLSIYTLPLVIQTVFSKLILKIYKK